MFICIDPATLHLLVIFTKMGSLKYKYSIDPKYFFNILLLLNITVS